jgi:hypothetical protein
MTLQAVTIAALPLAGSAQTGQKSVASWAGSVR